VTSEIISFRFDNVRVFQRVSMNFNMTVGHVACWLLCHRTQSTLASSSGLSQMQLKKPWNSTKKSLFYILKIPKSVVVLH